MLVIEFKLDPHLYFGGNFSCDTVLDDVSFPIDGMKKHVICEVFGLNETVFAFLLDERDLAKSSPLNAKLFLDPSSWSGSSTVWLLLLDCGNS